MLFIREDRWEDRREFEGKIDACNDRIQIGRYVGSVSDMVSKQGKLSRYKPVGEGAETKGAGGRSSRVFML